MVLFLYYLFYRKEKSLWMKKPQNRRLANAEIGVDTEHLGDIIQNAYMQTVFDVTKGADYCAAFDLIPESRVKAILSTNWSGQMFSERVWDNTNALANGLKHDMLVGIMAGKSEQHMADDIMNRCGVGAFEARRLVRTETTCVANTAELYGYKELDIDEYEFSACLDSRTSDLCRELDGKVFKRNSAQAGVNLPPMHPFCRSTTLPVLPSEEDLDKELAELCDEIGADVDFDEWERNLQQGEDGKWRYVAGSAGKATQTVVTLAKETVSGFTPAKSIEEAQAYAQQFIEAQFGDKTFKGKADFKGVSLENANEINRALEELFDKYDISKISGIKAIDPLSAKGKKIFSGADAVMAYSPVEQGIYINKNVLKNAETLAAYNKQAKDAWNTVMSSIDTLNGAEKELALRYKQAGRSIVGDGSVHDYFLHEMGHHVQWQAFDAKTNNLIGSQMSKYAGNLSGYATASKSEYFAESFVALQKGEISKLDPEYVAFMKGRAIDKVGKSGIIKKKVSVRIDLQHFAIIPKEKFTKYALDPVKQPDKARAFKEALGYTMENYQELIDNISANLDQSLLKLKQTNEHGKLYEYVMQIKGPNGKQANVCTGWIIENGATEPRLTSAYVTEKKVTKSEI